MMPPNQLALMDVPALFERPKSLEPGPPGRTCGECRHLERHRFANTYYICALIARGEIVPRRASIRGDCKRRRRKHDPACQKFEPVDVNT